MFPRTPLTEKGINLVIRLWTIVQKKQMIIFDKKKEGGFLVG
jgi:hypothetical protein